MTSGLVPGECDGGDAASYVLGALEPEEAVMFARHLAACAACRAKVSSLQPAANALSMSVPQLAASRQLKRRVIKRVRREATVAGPAGGVRRARARPALAAAAVLAAFAAGVVVVELGSGSSGGERLIHASVTARSASAVVILTGDHAELTLTRMPAPPRGKIYEVWLKRPGRPPAPTIALFSVNTDGSGAVAVPGNLKGVSEVLVTPEPLGGSAAPTHAPVIIAQLHA